MRLVRARCRRAGTVSRTDPVPRGTGRGRQPWVIALTRSGPLAYAAASVAPRPVVRDGEVVVRDIGYVSVTFDHRSVDGARAAEFGLAVIQRLEA